MLGGGFNLDHIEFLPEIEPLIHLDNTSYQQITKTERTAAHSKDIATPWQQTILLHPNPVRNDLYVELLPHQDLDKVELFGNLGQPIHHIPLSKHQKQLVISLRDLPSGIYFIRLHNRSNEYIVKRFVKIE